MADGTVGPGNKIIARHIGIAGSRMESFQCAQVRSIRAVMTHSEQQWTCVHIIHSQLQRKAILQEKVLPSSLEEHPRKRNRGPFQVLPQRLRGPRNEGNMIWLSTFATAS
eukprot:scaffold358_cov343-Pavlova_lutheri.AAC.19